MYDHECDESGCRVGSVRSAICLAICWGGAALLAAGMAVLALAEIAR